MSLIPKTLNQTLEYYSSKLDYTVNNTILRKRLVRLLLNRQEIRRVSELMSTSQYRRKFYKTGSDRLSEYDRTLYGWTRIANYLLNRGSLLGSKYARESPVGGVAELERRSSSTRGSSLPGRNKYELSKTVVTAHLKETYPEIGEVCRAADKIGALLGVGFPSNQKHEQKQQFIRTAGFQQYKHMMRLYIGLRQEAKLLTEALTGTTQRPPAGYTSSPPVLHCDTGYFDELGDYVQVSENKIDLKNKRHVAAMLLHYESLKQRSHGQFASDLWALMLVLEQLIACTSFSAREQIILYMKVRQYAGEEIACVLSANQMPASQQRISQIFNHVIPNKISATYRRSYENWLQTRKKNVSYKCCTKCREIKPLNSTNFRRRGDSDNVCFRNECRKCELAAKKA